MTVILWDFTDPAAVLDWGPINDVVMGGRSSGRLEATEDQTVAFLGSVSLENNGGFASVRTRPREHDLGGCAGLELWVRGDGKRYKINLESDSSSPGVLWATAFEASQDSWERLRLPFSDFEPTFRGRAVHGGNDLDLRRITSFGLMISGAQEGPFRLELARLGIFRVE